MSYVTKPMLLDDTGGFVDAMRPIAQKTALNYLTDGGTSGAPLYDTTYDKVFLPSGLQHNLQDTASYGGAEGKEGPAWEFWKQASGGSSALAWGATHPEYIQYDLASPTSARNVWLRSAHRGHGRYVAIVYSSGHCYYDGAVSGLRCAPACAIG